MSSKNFMAYGDAETILTGFANTIKGKAKTYILNTESTDESSTTYIPLANISNLPTCNVGDIIVLKVNANYTFNKNVGGRWKFKINGVGRMISLLWADESDFNQDLPKGSCVVFVYNNTTVLGNFFTVISFDVKNFDPSTVVQKSQTAGLLKNDGTVDTTTYASEAGTESLIDSTVGWTGKNLLDITLASIKASNVSGTWTGNTYVKSGVSFDVSADNDGRILEISVSTDNGGATENLVFTLAMDAGLAAGVSRTINGCPSGGDSGNKYDIAVQSANGSWISANYDYGSGSTGTDGYKKVAIEVKNGTVIATPIVFYPMIRDSRITDSTYEPYHKSVEECLEDINDKLSYLETTATLSTSAATTVTFTSAKLTTSSCVEVGVSEWGLVPDDVTVSTGSCTVTLPIVDSAHTVTVRLYVR